ncbi:MAG: hypothetical protein ACJ749_13970 [Flavisolibacter sp.]
MKQATALILLLMAGTILSAQTMDTVHIVQKARKFKPKEHILIKFEVFDTLDAIGRKTSISRSYYFYEKQRMISSVREYDNPKRPKKGTQLIYSFSENKLRAVTVIPPKSTCRNCASEYYFSSDTLLAKTERVYTNPNPAVFIRNAYYFQAKLPRELPWGYFEDEVIVNGKMKRLKHGY